MLKVLAVLALVLLNGFFVAAEFALVRVRETQLDMLVARAGGGRKMARHIVRHLNSYLSATQLGITMASLGLGWIWASRCSRPLLAPLLAFAGGQFGNAGSIHFLRRRFQRADVSAHHGGRTGAEMADDPKAVAGGALGRPFRCTGFTWRFIRSTGC